ncbi:hypothetical protein PQS31_06475 [Luteimonas sp BLCC-B24]|uniref:hypothetical protein n=1 Tax=Luteimonas sp. BLCC-B24 TaxID=3025317 RepID=UPI00234D905F|nr:hypothetical protein [Luteimonas sp. BLCC-B24]MDC7806465.1 hypothetical protein [Luteimonas sp. BLCC-B24]
MSTPAPAPGAPAPRRRRWLFLLAVLVAAGLGLALSVRVLLPPERALHLVLERLGPALGLELTFDGTVDYRLRGTPQLEVRNVVARMPGETTPLLRADRVLVSLPWSTIRSRGAELEIARIELDAPSVHLPALLRWLDARPPGDGRVPPFTDGLRIRNGVVDADGWRIEALMLELPALHPDRAVDARVAGTAVSAAVSAPFQLRVRADRLVELRTLDANGSVTLRLPSGRLDTRLQFDATRIEPAAPGLHLAPVRLAADAHWRARATSLPFAFGLQGRLAVDAGRFELAPVGIATRAEGPVPTLAAGGRLVVDDALQLALDGRIARWPEAWPALPAPLGDSGSPMPFALRYAGPRALDAPLALRVEHAGARFDGHARVPAVLQWLDAIDTGSPVPPLQGRLTAPRVALPGTMLEDLQIEFDDGSDE